VIGKRLSIPNFVPSLSVQNVAKWLDQKEVSQPLAIFFRGKRLDDIVGVMGFSH